MSSEFGSKRVASADRLFGEQPLR